MSHGTARETKKRREASPNSSSNKQQEVRAAGRSVASRPNTGGIILEVLWTNLTHQTAKLSEFSRSHAAGNQKAPNLPLVTQRTLGDGKRRL